MILFLCNIYFIAEAKEVHVDNMSLYESEKDIHVKSPGDKGKVQSIKKKRKSGERSTPVRTSPRKKMAIENVRSNTEDLSSKSTEVQPAVVNNTRLSQINSVGEESKKEEDTLKRSCPDPTNKLQTESKETDCALKLNVKTLQRQSKTSILTEKNGETSDFFDARRNGHHKAKRQLIDDESPKKRMLSKKTKPAHQVDQADGKKSPENDKSVELSSNRTLNHKNGFEEKDWEASTESHVEDSAGAADKESDEVVDINTSVSSDVSSDDELLSDAFSPSQESSKFIAYVTVTVLHKK